MALYQSTFRSGRVDAPRLPVNEVGSIFGAFADVARQQEEKRRFDEQDARAKQLHDLRMAEVQEAKDTRDFMRGYDPQIGVGGRGVETRTQRALAEEGGDVVTRLLSSRGIKTAPDGKGVGITEYMAQAPEEDRQTLLAGLSDIGSRALGRLQETATKEVVRSRVFEDVLKQTGRADLAKQTADIYASDYVDRDTLKAQEAAATKEANEVLQRQAENIKDSFDRQYKQAEFNRKKADSIMRMYEKATRSNKEADMVDVYKSLAELDIGPYDNAQARRMITAARDEGFTPAEILSGMRNMYTEGALGREFTVDKPEDFVVNLKKMRNSKQLNTDFRSAMENVVEPRLTPQDKRILARATTGVVGRDLGALLDARGRGAFGRQTVAVPEVKRNLEEFMDSTAVGSQKSATPTPDTSRPTTPRPVEGDVGIDLEQEYKDEQQRRLEERLSRYLQNLRTPSNYGRQVQREWQEVKDFAGRSMSPYIDIYNRYLTNPTRKLLDRE